MMIPPEAANRLRAWRTTANVSQSQLAKVFGLKQPAVALWENRGRPDLARALELQAFTGGAVMAVVWGYSEERIARVLLAAEYQGHRSRSPTLRARHERRSRESGKRADAPMTGAD